MVVKTRSSTNSYDLRVRFRSNNGSWSNVGGSTETLVSSVTADYPKWDHKRLISEGQNAVSEMSATRVDFRLRPLSGSVADILKLKDFGVHALDESYMKCRYYELVNGNPFNPQTQELKGNAWGQFLSFYIASDLHARIESQALQGFNDKVLKTQRGLQGLVSLGELGQSLRMIRRPAVILRQGVTEMYEVLIKRTRRIRNRSPRIIRQLAADTWLEYAFGWRPLISDVREGAEALSHALHVRRQRQFVSYTQYGSKTQTAQDLSNGGGSLWFDRFKQVQSYYIGVKFYGVVGLPDPGDGFDQSRFGISWAEVAPAAWELIPYSFLVDYFSNIGDIISSYRSTLADVKWMARGTCYMSESSWSRLVLRTSPPANRIFELLSSHPGEKCYKVNRTINRQTYTGTRIPSFELTVPGMGLKWLNMAALALSDRRAYYASLRR